MGFLSNLFGGGPEKHEEKGDELRLDLQYSESAFYYKKALEAIKDPADARAERIRSKLREVRRQAAHGLMDEAEELAGQNAHPLAREKLEMALQFSDDHDLSAAIERQMGDVDAALDTTPPPPEEMDIVTGTDEEDIYELALSGLEPQDLERARGLGEEFRLGYEACQNERWEESLGHFQPLLADHPDDPLLLEMTALVHEKLGDWAAARETYDRAWNPDAPRPSVAMGLAATLVRLGRGDEARTVLRQAVEAMPADADLPEAWIDVHLEYAMALASAERADDAIGVVMPLFGAAAANHASLYYNLAGLLEQADREDEARAALEKAIEIAPRTSVYRERLADFLVHRGWELDEALKLLVEANEVETVGPAGMLGGGGSKVLISPHRGRYLYKMARIYFLKGEDLEAERTITTALHVAKDPDVLKALEDLRRDLQESRTSS